MSVLTSSHIQSVARQFRPVRSDNQAGLPQLPHHRDLGNAGNFRQDFPGLLRLVLQRRQVGTEYFDGQRALQPGFGFIHGVLGGLGVIENDAGKHLQFLLHRLDQLRLGVNLPAPRLVVVWFQPHVELVVEEPGRVRGVVGTPQLVGHRGHLRKAQQDVADLGRELGRFLERDGVRRRGAHPQRAFIEVRHEFARRYTESASGRRRRPSGPGPP